MELEGPILESLTRKLAETPEDFLGEPLIGKAGTIHVDAVVGDLLRGLGQTVNSIDLSTFRSSDAVNDRNRLSITLILCWLLSDDWFRRQTVTPNNLLKLLEESPAELATHVAARKFVNDAERREELARVALARLGFRPAGETVAQAQDRLATLSSAERARVLKAARIAEERARQIREALARKAAEESADKWTRE